jgi:hypothetical protein
MEKVTAGVSACLRIYAQEQATRFQRRNLKNRALEGA